MEEFEHVDRGPEFIHVDSDECICTQCGDCTVLSAELERLMSHVRKAGDELDAHFETHSETGEPS